MKFCYYYARTYKIFITNLIITVNKVYTGILNIHMYYIWLPHLYSYRIINLTLISTYWQNKMWFNPHQDACISFLQGMRVNQWGTKTKPRIRQDHRGQYKATLTINLNDWWLQCTGLWFSFVNLLHYTDHIHNTKHPLSVRGKDEMV